MRYRSGLDLEDYVPYSISDEELEEQRRKAYINSLWYVKIIKFIYKWTGLKFTLYVLYRFIIRILWNLYHILTGFGLAFVPWVWAYGAPENCRPTGGWHIFWCVPMWILGGMLIGLIICMLGMAIQEGITGKETHDF